MKKLSLKYKILIGISIFIILIAIVLIFIYTNKDKLLSHLGSSNISLNENYKGIVNFSSDVNFMFVIDKDNKVSNLLFLDEKAIRTLSDKNIEGKPIEEATYDIINLLNNEKQLNKNIILTSYDESNVILPLKETLNKNLVIFGIPLNISNNKSTLKEKVKELNLNVKESDLDNVKEIYNYSKNMLLNKSIDELTKKEENISYLSEAQDIYTELDKYAKGEMEGYKIKVENQQKDDPNGLKITDIESSKGYKADNRSWYSITNSIVTADIVIEDNEYCFNGNIENYIEGACNN